jgi:hypothetical protein
MSMKITCPLTVLAGCFFLHGCVPLSQSYYLSPVDINSNYYHTIPMHSDSQKVATYASMVLHAGTANFQNRDGLFGITGSIHQSYQLGNHFQGFAGASLMMGSYHIARYDIYEPLGYPPNYQDSVIRTIPYGDRFYGSIGIHAGMNTFMSVHRGQFEWRIIGWEGSLQREFGDYQSFRRNLPDSIIDIEARYRTIGTLGGTTEFLFKRRSGTEIGFKLAMGGTVTSNKRYYVGDQNDQRPFYVSPGFHITKKKYTGFMQMNFGVYAMSVQFGLTYRLGKN